MNERRCISDELVGAKVEVKFERISIHFSPGFLLWAFSTLILNTGIY
jgi:hypothetical protein